LDGQGKPILAHQRGEVLSLQWLGHTTMDLFVQTVVEGREDRGGESVKASLFLQRTEAALVHA
jgi:hypothetical protein